MPPGIYAVPRTLRTHPESMVHVCRHSRPVETTAYCGIHALTTRVRRHGRCVDTSSGERRTRTPSSRVENSVRSFSSVFSGRMSKRRLFALAATLQCEWAQDCSSGARVARRQGQSHRGNRQKQFPNHRLQQQRNMESHLRDLTGLHPPLGPATTHPVLCARCRAGTPRRNRIQRDADAFGFNDEEGPPQNVVIRTDSEVCPLQIWSQIQHGPNDAEAFPLGSGIVLGRRQGWTPVSDRH